MQELRSDSLSHLKQLRGHRYFRALTPQTLNQDSVKTYSWTLRNATTLLPNNSRFEGLKSSGRLDVIEDDELLNSIMDHYQELIPSLTMNTSLYSSYKRENMNKYLDTHLSADGHNLPAVMASLPMQNYLNRSLDMRGILLGYHTVMQHSRDLIRQLDHHLK